VASSDTEHKRALTQMRKRRAAAMKDAARRDIALAILDEKGEVSKAAVDERLEQEYTEPTAELLDNMMAQKTAASAAYEDREVGAYADAHKRSGERVRKLSVLLDAAKEAEANAKQELDAARERSEIAATLAEIAAENATGPAPVGESVNATAGTATGNAAASGGRN
jgi:hypothetical protein